MHSKMSSGKCRPSYLGLNVLRMSKRHETRWNGKAISHRGGGFHYNGVIMGTMASQITSLTFVYSTFYSGADQRKHQSSASLAFVWGIHRGPVNFPHKWPVTQKMFPFDDVIMSLKQAGCVEFWCFVGLNKLLKCQLSRQWFEIPWRSCDVTSELPSGLLSMACHRENLRTVLIWLAALRYISLVFPPGKTKCAIQ